MDKQTKLVALTEDQQSALQAICRRRKADALVRKRARPFLLMDAGYDAKTICENLVPLLRLVLDGVLCKLCHPLPGSAL